jgi:hypothetical protein
LDEKEKQMVMMLYMLKFWTFTFRECILFVFLI